MDIYVNGQFRDCATTGSEFINIPAVANDMYIGLPWFNGLIDEVRCGQWQGPQQEIQECMNNSWVCVAMSDRPDEAERILAA